MTVKDILKIVCDLVGDKELLQKLENSEELSTNEDQKVKLLVRCFNLVEQEIASEYIPFMQKEKLHKDGGMIMFSELSKKVINVFEIRNCFGIPLKFRLFPNFVEVDGKARSIVYSFLPEEKTLESEVEMCCGLTARIYAYGVASEFLLVDGLGENAQMWEERFKQSLFVLSRKRGEHLLPARRWL